MIPPPWSDDEVACLRRCAAAKMTAEQIACLINRSPAAIRTRRTVLGLPPPSGRRYFYDGHHTGVFVSKIKPTVAAHFDIPAERLDGPRGNQKVARARQVAMFLAREVAQKSYPQIGALFGRDHTTVIHAVRQVERLASEDSSFSNNLKALFSQLKSKKSDLPVDRSVSMVADAIGAGA